ncbi:3-keto-5-aminohexanoate cleavage protein [Nannocystis bainbridge]|uniref:3-keto-5-aminohexanoate cleavage protein n=1 Tax=Nannocystis bainbridge TaxID=2995303 RepID=A0ABT5DTA6_9BACT|nr:3-keto-5-aminohexanoate cleavage protein [Nannocystis bainbridge]MDC0716875.1 3-keto-5-aminohexanoate cleavage protein [Nannocystis bainbridge]
MTHDKAIVTCALTGVLTNPKQHPVPVTPEELARAARQARDAGASVVHVHFRRQEPGMGFLPSWEPEVAIAVREAIRAECPELIFNMTTGVVGDDISGPVACMRAIRPEIAACNAGSLNYLKAKSDGTWAWPPMVFDNPVDKVKAFLDVMAECGTAPEFECFDLGIVRSVGLFVDVGLARHPHYNFVTGVASGMPTDPDLLPFLLKYIKPGSRWEVTAIGREEIWAIHRRTAELGGDLRTGLEDTFYLPDGSRADSNGRLIEALVASAREVGREIASPAEARQRMHLAV